MGVWSGSFASGCGVENPAVSSCIGSGGGGAGGSGGGAGGGATGATGSGGGAAAGAAAGGGTASTASPVSSLRVTSHCAFIRRNCEQFKAF